MFSIPSLFRRNIGVLHALLRKAVILADIIEELKICDNQKLEEVTQHSRHSTCLCTKLCSVFLYGILLVIGYWSTEGRRQKVLVWYIQHSVPQQENRAHSLLQWRNFWRLIPGPKRCVNCRPPWNSETFFLCIFKICNRDEFFSSPDILHPIDWGGTLEWFLTQNALIMMLRNYRSRWTSQTFFLRIFTVWIRDEFFSSPDILHPID